MKKPLPLSYLRSVPTLFIILFLFPLLYAPLISFSQDTHPAPKYKLGPQLVPEFIEAPLYNVRTGNLITTCTNSNFSLGNFTNWTGCYGSFNNPCQNPGFAIAQRRHVIEILPATKDPYSCNAISTVFPGEEFSARLGDTAGGGHSEQLKYQVNINSGNYLFVYRYAVVLESPDHNESQQPAFKIEVQDMAGNLVDQCGFFNFTAPACPAPPNCPESDGWFYCKDVGYQNDGCYYKDWTTVGMNLQGFEGLGAVKIVFQTRGCSFTAHRGYAYVSAYCNALQIQTSYCEGSGTATITAPPGFSTYLWQPGGGTEDHLDITNPQPGDVYTCTLTSVNLSCAPITITSTLNYTAVTANFEWGAACTGQSTQFSDKSTVTQNTIDAWLWDFGDGQTSDQKNPTHTFLTPGDHSVTLTAYSTEGCTNTVTKTVTVSNLPNVTNPILSEAICSGGNTGITLTSDMPSTDFTWTASCIPAGSVTGFSDNSNPGVTTIDHLLTNTTYSPATVTYVITPHANGCSGVPVSFYVTVNPTPDVSNNPASKTICSGTSTSATLTSNVAGAEFTWTSSCSPAGSVTGFTDNALPGIFAITDILTNTTYTAATVTYVVTPHASGCDGVPVSYVVTVDPSPDLSNSPPSKTICSGTNTSATLTSNVSGTDFTWTSSCNPPGTVTGFTDNALPGVTSINDILTNSNFIAATVTYVVTPHANGCAGTPVSYIVTINPTPDLSNDPAAKTICSGTNTSVTLLSNISGTDFTWSSSCNPPGSVTGFTDNSAPGVTTISDVLTNTTFAAATVTYVVTPHASGCAGTSVLYIVTVDPTPDLSNNPASKTICSGTNTSAALTSNVSGTDFTWTSSCSPAGSVTGFTDNSTPGATTISDVLTNTTYAAATVTYVVTPHANGCAGSPVSYVVTVNPTPDLSNNPASKTICSGTNTSAALTSNVTGTDFTWTSSCSPAGSVTGFTANALPGVTSISDILTNTTYTAATVTYVVTPHASGCSGTPVSYVVTVNPTPDLSNNPASKTICSGTNTSAALTSNVTGTDFTWTSSCNPAGSVTGFTDNSAPGVTSITDVLTNTTFAAATVTYVVTPHANGCAGVAVSYIVTVNPTPDVSNNPAAKTICSATNTSITLTSNVSGTDFTWTSSCSPAGSVTGFTANALPGVTSITDVLTNTTFAAATVTYVVTPHANGCAGTPVSYIVTVNPTPDLSNNPASKTICSATNTLVTLTSHVTGTDFTWTSSCNPAGSVTGFTANALPGVTSITDVLTNTTYAAATVTYVVTPHANGCAGSPVSYIVTVNPTPDVSNNPASKTICSATNASVTLTSNVSGTDFTWTSSCSPAGSVTGFTANALPGVTSITDVLTNTTYAPATVTYVVTPHASGCAGAPVSYVVTVNPTPDLSNNPASRTICSATNTAVTLTSNVIGADFTWTASCSPAGSVTGFTVTQATPVITISDNLTNTTNGIATVTYLVTPHANNCAGVPTSYVVTVNPKPTVIFPASPPNPQQVCSGAVFTPVPLQSNVTLSTITYAWIAQAFDPVNPTSGITGFTTPNSGNPIPGENITSSLLVPGVIKYSVTATFTSGGIGCPGDPFEYQVIVNPSPTVALTPSDPVGQTICSGLQSQIITFTPNVTPTTYTWLADQIVGVSGPILNGTSDNIPAMMLTTTGAAQGFVRYKVTPTYQGSGSFTCPGGVSYSTIFVNPLPSPSFTYTSPVCEYGTPITYQTSLVTGNSYLWDVTGAAGTSGGNTNQVTVSWGAAGTGTLRVQESINATGCVNYYPPITQNPVQITLQQRPVPTLTGPAAVCENSTGNLYLTDIGSNSNYTWLISGGTITSGGNGFPTATVTWTNPGTTNWIEVNYQNALGCPGFPPKRNTVEVNPLPVSTFTGSTSVCPQYPSPYLYTANAGPACSYTWSILPASYGTIANSSVSPASVNWNTTGNATMRLDAVTGFGCATFSTQPITINPLPVVSITPCFDVITNRSAQKFLLKGGRPLLTSTPMQGEYLVNPATPALTSDASGNYFFEPALVPGTNTTSFSISYRYTSSQFGCVATSPSSVSIMVYGANPSCGTSMTDYRDIPPTTYRTAFMGGKCWMAENLRYGSILYPITSHQTDNCQAEKYCLSTDANCTSYGGFYQWDELIQYGVTTGPAYQGVCPPGWHIPSAADFQALIDENQGNGIAGSFLKDMNLTPRGFEALFKGMAYLNTAWAFTATDYPSGTLFWTSTAGSGNRIITRGVNSVVLSVQYYEATKSDAFPVRCVRD